MKNYIWVFLEKISLIIIKMLFLTISARYILPEDFGVFAIAIFLINSLGIIVDSGMAGSVIREKNIDQQDYFTLNYFNVVTAMLITIIVIIFSNAIADYYNKTELSLILNFLSLVIVFRAFSTVYFTYLTRKFKFAEQAKITFIAAIFSVFISLGMIWIGWAIWALVVQQIIESLMVFLFLFYVTKINFFRFRFNKNKFMKHFKFGVRLSLASLIDSSFSNIILNKLNTIGGIKAVGSYSQNVKISELFIGVLMMTVDKVMMPVLAKNVNNDNDLMNYAYQTLMYLTAVAYFFICLLIVFHYEIVMIILGKQWVSASWMLSLIGYCGFAQIIEMVCRSILKSQGYSSQLLFISILKLVALCFGLTMLASYGIKQLLFTLIGLSWLYVLLYLILIYKYLSFNIFKFLQASFASFVAAVIMIICSNLMLEPTPNISMYSSLILIIEKSFLLLMIYLIILLLLGFPLLNVLKAFRNKLV